MAKRFLQIAVLVFLFSGCSKDCEPILDACKESPPVDEACQAYFTRWFFDASKNTCRQISYSGCSQTGFATKKECEGCKC
jgi:hypothetical protein